MMHGVEGSEESGATDIETEPSTRVSTAMTRVVEPDAGHGAPPTHPGRRAPAPRGVEPRAEPAPIPGDRIGPYALEAPLGAGGMGVVFTARDTRLDRRVALKLLRPAAGSDRGGAGHEGWSEGRARLLREAQAMARLSHPNVVEVYDVGAQHDGLFIAMERIEGQTLRRWLKQPRDWRTIVEVFVQAGRGLAAAHAAGLVHRDFKPANVLVDRQGRARVMDFGLALPALVEGGVEGGVEGAVEGAVDRAGGVEGDRGDRSRTGDDDGAAERTQRMRPSPSPAAEGTRQPTAGHSRVGVWKAQATDRLRSPVTELGMVVGTPAYMAPEQHVGREVGAAADQYAFCVALYEGLVGTRPFVANEVEALVRLKRAGTLPPWPTEGGGPTALRRIVARGLRPDPRERWPSMDALLQALQAVARPPRRWGRWALLGVGGLGLAVVAGLTWLDREPPSRCADGHAALDDTWNEARRDAVQSALVAGGEAYAADTAQRVIGRLDDYALGWRTYHDARCEPVPPADATAARAREHDLQCLGQRLRRMGAVIDVLEDSGAAVLPQAVSMVDGLTSAESCGEADTVAALALPDDPVVAARMLALHGALDRVQALIEGGQYERARDVARLVRRRAQAQGLETMADLAAAWVGNAQIHLGEHEAAEAVLVDALHRAEASGDDAQVVMITTRLAFLVGHRLGRADDGLRWIRHGLARLPRLPGDRLAEAELRTAEGSVLADAGRLEEAAQALAQGVQLWSELRGPDDLQTAVARNNLGIAYFELGRYEDAIAQYEEVLRIREQGLGPLHPEIGQTLNNLANAVFERGDRARALALRERVLQIWREGLGEDHPYVAAAYNNLGNSASEAGDPAQAIAYYEKANALREAALGPEHPELATSILNLGIALSEAGRHDEALQQLRRACATLDRTVGEHPWTAACLGAKGEVLAAAGEHEAARVELEAALTMQRTVYGEEHPAIVEVQRMLGESLLALGQPAQARAQLEAVLVMAERVDTTPDEAAVARFALARGLRAQGVQPERARRLAQQAREVLASPAASARSRRRLPEVDAWLAAPDVASPPP